MGALGSHENDSLSEEPIIAKMYGGKHLSARQGAPEWVRGGLGTGREHFGLHGMSMGRREMRARDEGER